jgi:archaellum component FlaC
MKLAVLLVLVGLSGMNAKSIDFTKKMARARLEKEGLPDPVCRTGIISLPIASLGKKQACCPAYCKECDDYKTCESVREQASENACCASKVLKLECGKGAPANICLKKCSEALPPCIMEDGQVWRLKPPKVNAADDCNEAIVEWRQHGKAAIKAGNEAVEEFEAKIALKTLEHVLKTHQKLLEETEETIEEIKAEGSADAATLKDIEGTIELLGSEIKKAVKLNDFMAQALLHDLKEKLQQQTTVAQAAEEHVSDAITDMESAKEKLGNYLETLKGHKDKAEDFPKHLLDKDQDIDLVHDVAEEIRDLQFEVTNATNVLEAALQDAEHTASKAKE